MRNKSFVCVCVCVFVWVIRSQDSPASESKVPTGEVIGRIGPVVLGVFIKVAQISIVFQSRNIGRLERARSQALPAETLEPLVLVHVLEAAALVADAIDGVLLAQLLDQRGGYLADAARKVDGLDALQDIVVDGHGVVADEGRVAREQLEYEHAQAPVVRANVVTFV